VLTIFFRGERATGQFPILLPIPRWCDRPCREEVEGESPTMASLPNHAGDASTSPTSILASILSSRAMAGGAPIRVAVCLYCSDLARRVRRAGRIPGILALLGPEIRPIRSLGWFVWTLPSLNCFVGCPQKEKNCFVGDSCDLLWLYCSDTSSVYVWSHIFLISSSLWFA
jgi:hypothetical protein